MLLLELQRTGLELGATWKVLQTKPGPQSCMGLTQEERLQEKLENKMLPLEVGRVPYDSSA